MKRSPFDKGPAYIGGPLTELTLDPQIAKQASVLFGKKVFCAEEAKNIYERFGKICTAQMQTEAIVPHLRYDPIKHSHFSADDVYRAEHKMVSREIGLLVAVHLEPSGGLGGEIQICKDNWVPWVLIKPRGKISRFVIGNPEGQELLKAVIEFTTLEGEDLERVGNELRKALRDLGFHSEAEEVLPNVLAAQKT